MKVHVPILTIRTHKHVYKRNKRLLIEILLSRSNSRGFRTNHSLFQIAFVLAALTVSLYWNLCYVTYIRASTPWNKTSDTTLYIVPHFVTAHVIDTSSFDRRGTTELLDLVSNPTLINCEKKNNKFKPFLDKLWFTFCYCFFFFKRACMTVVCCWESLLDIVCWSPSQQNTPEIPIVRRQTVR